MKINDTGADGASKVDGARRRLMKISAVAGGTLAAASLLPGSWVKPLATIGGIPAHAQTSDAPLVIHDLTIGPPPVDGPRARAAVWLASFAYTDPLCKVNGATTLFAKVEGVVTPLYDEVPLSDAGISCSSYGCNGIVQFTFNPADCNGTLTVRLTDAGRLPSNELSGIFACT